MIKYLKAQIFLHDILNSPFFSKYKDLILKGKCLYENDCS